MPDEAPAEWRAERCRAAQAELHAILHHESLARAGILILANKQARAQLGAGSWLCLPVQAPRLDLTVGRGLQDLKDAMSVEELSSALGLTSIRDHAWHMQPCCALRCAAGVLLVLWSPGSLAVLTQAAVCSGNGLEEGLAWIADRVRRS